MGVFSQLRIVDPVPALLAPARSHHLQQGFWGGPEAGEKQMPSLKWPALARVGKDHFNDPAGAVPGCLDVIWGFFFPQRPDDFTSVVNLVIRWLERDMAVSLEFQHHLPHQALLICG